jgi:YD repeat-containing protein
MTAGQTHSFENYSYNLAGALTSETYPSGRVISYSYDAANRRTRHTGSLRLPVQVKGNEVPLLVDNDTGIWYHKVK